MFASSAGFLLCKVSSHSAQEQMGWFLNTLFQPDLMHQLACKKGKVLQTALLDLLSWKDVPSVRVYLLLLGPSATQTALSGIDRDNNYYGQDDEPARKFLKAPHRRFQP